MTRSERVCSVACFGDAVTAEGVDWATDDGRELANMLLVLEPINSTPIPAQSYVSRTKGRIKNYDRLTKKQKAMRLRDEAINDLRVAGVWPAFWMIAKWALMSLAKRVLLNWLLSQLEAEQDNSV
jgi:hypothetical protein